MTRETRESKQWLVRALLWVPLIAAAWLAWCVAIIKLGEFIRIW